MKKYIYICLLIIASCATVKPPTIPVEPTKPVTNIRKEIGVIVDASPCTTYHWKNRGKAPKTYITGMAVMYAKQVCGQGSDFIKPNKIVGNNSIQAHKDALKYYDIKGSELNTYTFLIGLGMRESSGKYCSGRDQSQGFVKGNSAEAGIFQMAYVARVFNKEMAPLYSRFKNKSLPCELNTFSSPAIKCTDYDAKNFGTGEGLPWQKLMKQCPAASVQWAAILIRSNYRHFGPIIRKDVEYNISCRAMLSKVESVVKNNCSNL